MELDTKTLVEIEALYGILESLDYYQMLRVPRDAPVTAIERSFAQESKRFHPDRFYGLNDPDLQRKLTRIYRRIAEAWSVLKDPELKTIYDRKLRSDPPAEVAKVGRSELVQEKDEGATATRVCATRQGQKFYDLAIKARAAGDWNGVVMNTKFALQAEPDNATLKEQLAAAQTSLEEHRQKTKNPYKIRIV